MSDEGPIKRDVVTTEYYRRYHSKKLIILIGCLICGPVGYLFAHKFFGFGPPIFNWLPPVVGLIILLGYFVILIRAIRQQTKCPKCGHRLAEVKGRYYRCESCRVMIPRSDELQ